MQEISLTSEEIIEAVNKNADKQSIIQKLNNLKTATSTITLETYQTRNPNNYLIVKDTWSTGTDIVLYQVASPDDNYFFFGIPLGSSFDPSTLIDSFDESYVDSNYQKQKSTVSYDALTGKYTFSATPSSQNAQRIIDLKTAFTNAEYGLYNPYLVKTDATALTINFANAGIPQTTAFVFDGTGLPFNNIDGLAFEFAINTGTGIKSVMVEIPAERFGALQTANITIANGFVPWQIKFLVQSGATLSPTGLTILTQSSAPIYTTKLRTILAKGH